MSVRRRAGTRLPSRWPSPEAERLALSLDAHVAALRAGRVRRLLAAPLLSVRAKLLDETSRRFDFTVRARARAFFGGRMTVAYPAPQAAMLYRYGFLEEPLTRAVLRLVRPGDTFLDVGAHFGYYAMLASRLCGPSGNVVAFEPTPATFEVLARNLAGRPGVRCEPLAVSDRDGRAAFHDFGAYGSALNSLFSPRTGADRPEIREARGYEVRTVALDSYCKDVGLRPDFVKVDAESAELSILRGSETILRRHRPALAVEVGDLGVPGAPRSRAVVSHLLRRGYRAFEPSGEAWTRHRPRDAYLPGELIFLPR